MLSIVEGDRRAHERHELDRPCKVFDPRARRYLTGATRNISNGGVLIDVPRLAQLNPGDRLHVGIAFKRRDNFLRADEMIEAEVVRALPTVDDHTSVAVKWTVPQETPALTDALIDEPVALRAAA